MLVCVQPPFFFVVFICRGLLLLKHIGPYSVKAVGSLIASTFFEATGYVRNTTTGRQMKVELTNRNVVCIGCEILQNSKDTMCFRCQLLITVYFTSDYLVRGFYPSSNFVV